MSTTDDTDPPEQLLYLVFGGELQDLAGAVFKDPAALDVIGIYPSYARAREVWQEKAHQTVDNAQMRYFVVHLHRLLDPDQD